MEQDPGLRGMLSFLDTPPEEKARLVALRDRVDQESSKSYLPMAKQPMGQSEYITDNKINIYEGSSKQPMGRSPMENQVDPSPCVSQNKERPVGHSPAGETPRGQLVLNTESRKDSPPYMQVEGVGKRRLHYCASVQDAHTAGELVAYQALWIRAKKTGRIDSAAGYVIDLSLKDICELWKTDHKHAKKLLAVLVEKQNIEVIRQPNYQLGLPMLRFTSGAWPLA
jgi:hypothetical protein